MPTITAKNQKVKGVADIIFLLDATGSMASCINDVKENIARFLESIETPENPQEVAPVHDWRAAVYGFRDYGADGKDWLVVNPFTRSPEEVRAQLGALEATGGGDEPEDLLDALWKITQIGETEKNSSDEDPFKWRNRSQVARCVVVFTDATFHGCSDDGMAFVRNLATGSGITGEDVVNSILQNRLRVSIYAPEFGALGWHGYELFDQRIDKLEYMPIKIGSDNDPQRALAQFTGNRANFKKTLEQLAKSVSMSAEAVALDDTETIDLDAEIPTAEPSMSPGFGMTGAAEEAPDGC